MSLVLQLLPSHLPVSIIVTWNNWISKYLNILKKNSECKKKGIMAYASMILSMILYV